MFETQFRNTDLWKEQSRVEPPAKSRLSPENVLRVLHLRWAEHCVECAVPECYRQCPLYVKRSDGQCSRFVYGIWPNKDFKGHYDFWRRRSLPPLGQRSKQISTSPAARCRRLSKVSFGGCRDGPNEYLRSKRTGKAEWSGFDEFVVECFSPERESFQLVLEHIEDSKTYVNSFSAIRSKSSRARTITRSLTQILVLSKGTFFFTQKETANGA